MKDPRTWICLIGMLSIAIACGEGGSILFSALIGVGGLILCGGAVASWYNQEQRELYRTESLMAAVARHERHTQSFKDMLDQIQ